MNTITSIQAVLSKISFAPSCLDMSYAPKLGQSEECFFLQVEFTRPDTLTGEISRGYGRRWVIENDASETSIINTYYLACRQLVLHEFEEMMLYNGNRLVNPHLTIEQRMSIYNNP